MLMIPVTGVDFRAQLWLLPWQVKENTHTHTHALDEHTVWGQRPSMTHFDYSVLKQQVTGLPRMSSVSLASVQRQHSGPTESWLATCPIYKWAVLSLTSQVSRRCHVFILREFNPPFRMDQALCRWREADKCSGSYSTSSGECLENNPWECRPA